MIPFTRIFRDHRDAESAAGLLDLWGFVDEGVFLTKSGAVGAVLKIRGVDYECLDHPQRRQVVHRFEAATRVIDENTRVYQYLIKRRAAQIPAASHDNPIVHEAIQRRRTYLESKQDDLYTLDIYFVILYEGWRPRRTTSMQLRRLVDSPREAFRTWFSTANVATFLSAEIDEAVRRLRERTDTFIEQLADTLAPAQLDKRGAFRFFRSLLNYDPVKARSVDLKYDTHLDYFAADSSIVCQRAHLEVDDYCVKVLTLKDPPAQSFANLLEGLYTIPSEFIACTEWRRLDPAKIRRDIRAHRRHFHQARTSMAGYMYGDTRPEEMLVDDSATATVAQLGAALTEIEVHGHFFGEYSFTLALLDRTPQRLHRSVAAALKVFGAHDATLFEESYNVLNAWLAIIPGNPSYNVRRLPILETNYADLSFLFTLDTGQEESPHLRAEYLAAFETRHRTPYLWNLHHNDVGHTLILGATGSGKSFLVNFLLTHAQKYNPITLIFDVGGGYKKLTQLLRGAYLPIGLSRSDCVINPFSLEPTADNLHFLSAFVKVLVQSGGQYHTTMQDDRAIAEAVESVYHVQRSLRRLGTVANLLPRALSQYLARWIAAGPYASVFDNAEDTLTFSEFQAFDFERMGEYPLVLEALLFYILHRANRWIDDSTAGGRLKLVLYDEAWRFVLDDTIRRYIVEALKTWRKKNAALILATQSTEDFSQSVLLRTVVESCATKLLLANPSMDVEAYQNLFHLNHTEASLVADLVPRQQFLMKRPDVSKVLNLNVDQQSHWLYTHTTPIDDERVKAVFDAYGVNAGLGRLSQAS